MIKDHLSVKHFCVEDPPTFRAMLFALRCSRWKTENKRDNIKFYISSFFAEDVYGELTPEQLSFLAAVEDGSELNLGRLCNRTTTCA